MNELLENLATYTGIALGSYTALLLGAQAVGDLVSEKIKSQEQLDKIVDEESDKLSLDKRLVVAKFYAVGDKDYSTIRGARCYIEDFDFEEHTIPIKVVEIKEGWGARRKAVRHELYHLKKHLPRKRKSFIKSFFYEEPTATLYSLTGIQL